MKNFKKRKDFLKEKSLNENISDFLSKTEVPKIPEEENKGSIKKGDKVMVKMMMLEGNPIHEIESYNDSWIKEEIEYFSFLTMGDIMMIAKKVEDGWVSE